MAMLICAHRGASGYAPENTMKAFRLAHKLGAHACENDVHLTKDGEIVVIHDHQINRVSNGEGTVENMTLAQLRAFDYGDGEKIPTLDECLSFFDGSGMELNIEIKTMDRIYDVALVRGVGELVQKHGLESKIIISSFYHQSLVDYKKLFPKVRTAVLHGDEIKEAGAYAAYIGATYSHPHFKCVDEKFVEECHKNGILVNPWTVNEAADMRRMDELGCNMLITNYPDVALRG